MPQFSPETLEKCKQVVLKYHPNATPEQVEARVMKAIALLGAILRQVESK